jgi:hypothetical protein
MADAVACEHDRVELVLVVRELHGIADAEACVQPRRLGGGASLLDHRRGDVQAFDLMSERGQRERDPAVPAAEIEHAAAFGQEVLDKSALGGVQPGVGAIAEAVLGAFVIGPVGSARVVLRQRAGHMTRLTVGRRLRQNMWRPPLSALPVLILIADLPGGAPPSIRARAGVPNALALGGELRDERIELGYLGTQAGQVDDDALLRAARQHDDGLLVGRFSRGAACTAA